MITMAMMIKNHFHNDEYGDDEDHDGEGGDDDNNMVLVSTTMQLLCATWTWKSNIPRFVSDLTKMQHRGKFIFVWKLGEEFLHGMSEFLGGWQNYSHTIPILSARKALQYFVYRLFIAGYYDDKKQDHQNGGITKDFGMI